ncbi:hypothetical protein [Mucilaginibacter segetis]|uniref:Glycosyltransferase family 2 protein n=1 Tax=Mucilaginibacter segetis TaxID=2793071 RepID=A0A934PRN2_9SPHI|nr:hypothetical protein [Mucilaginibacter segetis]MBK0378192.1 hypothetical protein [Mucilaginibacter segetis]
MKNKVTLQINLSPGDYPHARYILKHQLTALSTQVDEIILNVETKPAKGRFAEGWNKYVGLLVDFLKVEIHPHYKVKIIPVDYSETIKKNVARFFFDTDKMPEKDFRGGPFYAYFFGLFTASNNLVFHLDSDMLLGGQNETWISEAAGLLEQPDNFVTSPLPGPPRADEKLLGQNIVKQIGRYSYELVGMSTRIFMLDKAKFKTHKLSLKKPSTRNQIKAIIQGNPNADLPENLFRDFMWRENLKRIDFLGSDDGMWSLHPPYRTANFYDNLPALIKRVEQNNLPQAQQGFYDIIDEVCDWTEARQKLKQNTWWKKLSF